MSIYELRLIKMVEIIHFRHLQHLHSAETIRVKHNVLDAREKKELF